MELRASHLAGAARRRSQQRRLEPANRSAGRRGPVEGVNAAAPEICTGELFVRGRQTKFKVEKLSGPVGGASSTTCKFKITTTAAAAKPLPFLSSFPAPCRAAAGA